MPPQASEENSRSLSGLSPRFEWELTRLYQDGADWRRAILSVIDWWMVTQERIIEIDGLTRGYTSSVAAERRKRIRPVAAAMHRLMSALGPALTATEVAYSWKYDFNPIDEMIGLFGLYTLSVREFAKTVLPELNLDLPELRESARAQLQATTDDLKEKLASLKNPSFKQEMQKNVRQAEQILTESSAAPASINDLMRMQEALAVWTGYLGEYAPLKIARAS